MWELDSGNGELQLTTGVTGAAAKMGHRLTIGLDWHATVHWSGDAPAAVEMTVDVGSLEVLGGDGGVTGLSGPEKALARGNAVKILDAKRHPKIVFRSSAITGADYGYLLSGTLQIRGRERDCDVELKVEDLGERWRMSAETEVRHSDFGLKPYSMMMGALKVADEVVVSFSAEYPKA
ncbi:S-adenosyl-L-methionine-dependent methyltransferase [Mycolicibacterium parafortuitum]|nr:S-adenosyl-L-methionine-dependent methyltransferase [Mycolicibacterium parafortuitum]